MQDFDNNDHIILIENENSDNAMTLKLINVEIKSTTGNPDEASTRNSFIKNVGEDKSPATDYHSSGFTIHTVMTTIHSWMTRKKTQT
jgi:hypothetical protein